MVGKMFWILFQNLNSKSKRHRPRAQQHLSIGERGTRVAISRFGNNYCDSPSRTQVKSRDNASSYVSGLLFVFPPCQRSRLLARLALRMSTTQRGTKGHGSGMPTAPVNPMNPMIRSTTGGTSSTVWTGSGKLAILTRPSIPRAPRISEP